FHLHALLKTLLVLVNNSTAIYYRQFNKRLYFITGMFQGQHIYIKYYIPKPSLSASCTVFTPITSIPFGGVHPSKLFFEQIILLIPNMAASLTRSSILETRLITSINPTSTI